MNKEQLENHYRGLFRLNIRPEDEELLSMDLQKLHQRMRFLAWRTDNADQSPELRGEDRRRYGNAAIILILSTLAERPRRTQERTHE